MTYCTQECLLLAYLSYLSSGTTSKVFNIQIATREPLIFSKSFKEIYKSRILLDLGNLYLWVSTFWFIPLIYTGFAKPLLNGWEHIQICFFHVGHFPLILHLPNFYSFLRSQFTGRFLKDYIPTSSPRMSQFFSAMRY